MCKLIKRITTLFLLLLCFTWLVPKGYAEGTLENGNYLTTLNFTNWDESEYAYSGIKLSPHAFIMQTSGKTYLEIEVTGYSRYQAIYMVKQEYNDKISEISLSDGGKIGSDWTNKDGGELTNYDKLKAEYVDENINSYFNKLTPILKNDSLDTAVFLISDVDLSKKIGLVGYLDITTNINWKKEPEATKQCNSLTFNIEADNSEKTFNTVIMTALQGAAQENLSLDIDLYAFSSAEKTSYWEQEASYKAKCLDDTDFKKCEYKIDTSTHNITAKLYLNDDMADQSIEVYAAKARSDDNIKYYNRLDNYIAGRYGVEWDTVNVYDKTDNSITFTFDSNEALFGKYVKFIIDDQEIMGTILLTDQDCFSPISYTDESTGIIYENTRVNLIGHSTSFNAVKSEDSNAIKSIEKVASQGNYLIYNIKFTVDGESWKQRNKGKILVPIPEEWDTEDFYAEITSYKNNNFQNTESISGNKNIVEIDGTKYLEYSNVSSLVLDGGNIAIAQIKKPKDVSELEAGTYTVEANFLKSGSDAQVSMASRAMDSSAILVVDSEGNKEVYLKFPGISLNDDGDKAYLGGLWNVSEDDTEYYDFATDEDGALLDNSKFDANTEFGCVTYVKVKLSDSTWDSSAKKYAMKIIAPAMGSEESYEYVYNNPIDADLVFYSVTKMDDDTVIPTYQKSVLRRSIDKAKTYDESLYTEESWETLEKALAKGEDYYYEFLNDFDAETNTKISKKIKEKSDAIEEAIANLKESDELTAAKEALRATIDEASKIEQDNKTDSAYEELQDAIAQAQAVYDKSGASVEEINAADEALKKAVETFKNSADQSTLDKDKLEDGTYTVNVTMWKAADTTQKSMSDGAVKKPVIITVKDGKYSVTAQFQPLTIPFGKENLEGYLKQLSYKNSEGSYTDATVDETYEVADYYNTGEDGTISYQYPKQLTFPLVNGTSGDTEEGYVDLQVFVPIMDAISEGSGTQKVYMAFDWTSLAVANNADKSELEKALEEAGKITDTTAYTDESVAAFEKALAAAEEVYDAVDPTAEEVQEAADALNKAREGLITQEQQDAADALEKAKEALQNAVNEAKTLAANTDQYTADSLSALNTEIEKAQVLLDNADATAEELNAETEKVNNAKDSLVNKDDQAKADAKTALQKAIEEAQKESGEGVTPASYSALTEEIEAAKKLLQDDSATAEALNAETAKLKELQEALVPQADKTALQEACNSASAIEDNNQDSWDDLQTVLAEAKKVLEDGNATAQEVEDAVNAINAAVSRVNSDTSKAELKDLIDRAKALDTTNCTKESTSALTSAISAAESVYNDGTATQTQVDQQKSNLQNAMNALVEKEDPNTIYDGEYEITGRLRQAVQDSVSMGDPSLYKPMTLVVTTDPETGERSATLKIKFIPMTATIAGKPFTGYLADLDYFPEQTDYDSVPKGQTPVDTTVEKYYDVWDEYNDPENGTDNKIKGQKYPYIVTMPIELGQEAMWTQVYVPVMEAIGKANGTSGNGTQYALLQLDWTTLKQVEGTKTDKTNLDSAIEKAEELLDGLKDGDPGNTQENVDTLSKALTNAKAVSDSMNVDQDAVDAATAALESAMALFEDTTKDVDKSELKKALKSAEPYLTNEKYTEDSRNTLKSAYDAAQKVYEDDEADQTQVNNAVQALNDAYEKLSKIDVDKSDLEKAIKAANKLLKNSDEYDASAVQNLEDALAKAENVDDDKEASQEDVDAAAKALNSLLNSMKPVLDKTDKKTGIRVQAAAGVFEDPSALELVVTEITSGADYDTAEHLLVSTYADKFKLYDVKLVDKKTREEVEPPEGYAVTVSFPIPSDYNTGSLGVYRVTNSLTAIPGSISDGNYVATLYHLSNYALTNKTTSNTGSQSGTSSGAGSGTGSGTGSGSSGTTTNSGTSAKTLDYKNLEDGVYIIHGDMVKTDKETLSMSDNAIDHDIVLTVKDRKYYLTMDFQGLEYLGQTGYLGELKYYMTGYKTNQYGAPTGTLGDVTVESVQKNKDGSAVSDSLGSNYPDVVTFELIPEALEDGYVPLQVFVPVMESIAEGTGTQPVYLKLDWSTIAAEDEYQSSNTGSGGTYTKDSGTKTTTGTGTTGTTGSTLNTGTKLTSSGTGTTSTLSSGSSLGSSSLKGDSSSSAVKTGDEFNIVLWLSLLLISGSAVGLLAAKNRRKKKADQENS